MVDRVVARVVTTEPVQVSDTRTVVTTDALIDAAESLNTRSATRVSLEHDPFAVSIMKSHAARVERGDKYDSLIIEMIYGQECGLTTGDTEEKYVLLRFPTETLPFTRQDDVDRLSVAVDLANFDKLEDLEHFENTVSSDGTLTKRLGRYSIIPDPMIAVSVPVIAGLIVLLLLKPIYQGYSNAVSKLTERVILKAAEHFASLAVDKMNGKVKGVLTAYRKNQSADGRPILVERVLTSRDVNIVLLERIDNDKEMEGVELHQIAEELTERSKIILSASEITLVRNAEGKWKFWYLHTADGHVIATDEAMSYTAAVLDRMTEEAIQKRSCNQE